MSTLTIQTEVAQRLLYILVLLGIGIVARSVGLLTERWTKRLNGIAFYIALPALVFTSVYGQPLQQLVSPGLFVGLWVVLFGTALVAWYVHQYRLPGTRSGVATIQSYHTSVGFLGLPLVAATFGDQITAIASVVLGIVGLTQSPMTIFLLVRVDNSETRLREELGELVRNPVLGSLLIGLLLSMLAVPVPSVAMSSLGIVSELALPIALLCVGASLPLNIGSVDFGAIGSIAALKLLVMPVLAGIVFSLLDVPPSMFVAGVVMLAMPTAVSTFVYAGRLGGDDQFASTNIFVTIVASVGTLFVLLQMIH